MNFLPVPKIMKWDWNLPQQYSCDQTILITSGCSFTSTTLRLDCACSWPGFMRDWCRFEYAEDWSYPGAGNFYISQSIIEAVESRSSDERSQCFVAVMWSGLNRDETVVQVSKQPKLNSGHYRQETITSPNKEHQAQKSFDYIKKTQGILEQYNIPYAFTYYINLLEPPFLPARDKTHHFPGYISNQQLNDLVKMQVLSSQKDCLYDFSFYKNYLDQSSDNFHPTGECIMNWTENVWLPALAKRGLICNT